MTNQPTTEPITRAESARRSEDKNEHEPSEADGLVFTARLTYLFPQESPIPVDFGEVEITGKQMQVLLDAPGEAMFRVLTHDSTVVQAVDWANRLERTEVGDRRLHEDWVLTYRMHASDSPDLCEIPELNIPATEDDDGAPRATFQELLSEFGRLEYD